MTTPPECVWILGMRYTITGFWAFKHPPNGSCSAEKCEIFIDPALEGQYARETLFHEIVHAHDLALTPGYYAQASTPRRPKAMRGRRGDRVYGDRFSRPVHLNERTVQMWGRSLFGTIRDPRNVAVFRYIFGDDFYGDPMLPCMSGVRLREES